jgi:hypothetical protein
MTVPPSFKLRKQTMPIFEKLFAHYLEPIINYARKYCPEPVLTVDNNLC